MFWDKYFKDLKENKDLKDRDVSPAELFRIVSQMIEANKPGADDASPADAEARKRLRDLSFGHTEAAIKGYLRYNGKSAEPWMYEWLAKSIEVRKHTDAEVKTALAFAALLAKRTRNPTDLVRIADMLVVRNFYGPVGEPKYETNIGELIDMAAEKLPAHPVPAMMSVNLALKTKDPKRMGDAADRLLSLGWPGVDFDEQMRKDVAEQVGKLVQTLKDDGKTDEAAALAARLVASQARDFVAFLTWKGEADLDLLVEEPLGATTCYKTPRTVFGGAILRNGFGKHAEEVYSCPRGFDGDYTLRVETIFTDPEKPVTEAKLVVVTHEGTQSDEKRQEYTINLAKPGPVVVKLSGGRRKEVLPFIAPPEPPAPAEKPRPKAKDAPKPPAPAPRR